MVASKSTCGLAASSPADTSSQTLTPEIPPQKIEREVLGLMHDLVMAMQEQTRAIGHLNAGMAKLGAKVNKLSRSC